MPILELVDPKDWIARTGLLLSRTRSPILLAADEAYAEYFKARSENNKQKLFRALDRYLKEKGGHWERVDRNKRSDGLMKHIYDFTRGAVAKDLLAKRIPEARHGALYVWQNADVSGQWAKILLEGALNIGSSSLSMLQAGSYNDGDKTKGLGLGLIKEDTVGDKLANAGQNVSTVVQSLVPPSGTGVKVETPTPVVRIDALKVEPGLLEKAKAALGKFFKAIYDAIVKGVHEIWENIRFKYARGGYIGTIGNSIGKLVLFILGKVAATAAPFVGSAIDLGQGVAQVIVAAKERILAKMRSSKFVVAPGHPMQIAHAIEGQMNWAIGKGLYNAAKGGLKLAGNIASWGASAIIDVVAACLEFAWKFLSRIAEGHWMRGWIDEVRSVTRDTAPDPEADGVRRPRIVYDDGDFKDLFERGCDASVCIPMMTLNTGLTGDQMMFMKMFDDRGTVATKDEFASATEYLTQLKEYGRNYLESTGFTFTSTDPVVRGAMWHAIEHHRGGKMDNVDKVLTFLAGN